MAVSLWHSSAAGLPWRKARYRRGALAARSSPPLQLQLVSTLDIWHQKLSSGLRGAGGARLFAAGTGMREIRLALTAGARRCTGEGTWGIADGLLGSIAVVALWFAGGRGAPAGTLPTAGAFATGALATGARAVPASGAGADDAADCFGSAASPATDASSLLGGSGAGCLAPAAVVRAGWARCEERGLQSA